MPTDPSLAWLVERIRQGDPHAWMEFIQIYQHRLAAFVSARVRDSHSVDDIVQETLLGFIRSLPFYDSSRDLENYLFTIAAHKIRDHFRKQQRHPMHLMQDLDSPDQLEPTAGIRGPSSLLGSAERLRGEEAVLVAALAEILEEWRREGNFLRIKVIELLFVAGWRNRDVAQFLGIDEQQVANYKHQVVQRLIRAVQQARDEGRLG